MLHKSSKYIFRPEEEYRDPKGCLMSIVFWFVIVLTIGFAILATSCKTVQCLPETIIERHDSIITKVHTDSVRVIERDSVYVEKGGDTVYVTKWKTLFKEHISNKVDTVYQDRVTSVVEVKTERYVPQYYRFCSWAFWIIVVLVLLRVAWWAFKIFYLHKG